MSIENECAVVPKSAFRTTPNDEVRCNDSFKGLSREEARNLDNYRHFRPSSQETKIDLLSKNDRNDILNFFDDLKCDVAKNSWSLVCSKEISTVFLRNAKWPGFAGYHRVNSDIFGYAYFGDGRKVSDIHFLT